MANKADIALVHCSIERLTRLTTLFQKRRSQLAESVGLTEHQWGVLEEISSEHFIPSMFARQRESSPAAVSKTIRQLVDKGFVKVSLHDGDGRQRNYDLTTEGQQVMSQLRQRRGDAIERVWGGLQTPQLLAFNAFAEELETRLQELVEQQSRDAVVQQSK